MRKNQLEKSVKNDLKNHQKNTQKNNKISRTMEWLKIPSKKQRDFSKNLINVDIDYLQYTCYQINEPLKNLYNILWFSGLIDTDNSNIEYNFNMNLSLTHTETQKWSAYIISFLSPWFAPIPIWSIEVYNPNKKWAIKSEWKIVLYWWYFRFKEILQEEAPEFIRFANSFENSILLNPKQIKNKSIYRRTRVDVAIDIKTTLNQEWLYKYIKPHKNSKHVPKPYNYQPEIWGFQSIWYIPRLSQWIGIRVYNKLLDIKAKNKQSWYPNYWTEENPVVTRMEIIYCWDFANDDLQNLINYSKYRIMWTTETKLKTKTRPKSQYSPLSAYEYFKRYAKNHWKTLREVLDDVTTICITEEEKDKYDEINERFNRI